MNASSRKVAQGQGGYTLLLPLSRGKTDGTYIDREGEMKIE
jgi:hypothetical protein